MAGDEVPGTQCGGRKAEGGVSMVIFHDCPPHSALRISHFSPRVPTGHLLPDRPGCTIPK
jgi:hypothetical protein